MTKTEQREAAEAPRQVVERIDRDETAAPAWYRERLVGRFWRRTIPSGRQTAWHWALHEPLVGFLAARGLCEMRTGFAHDVPLG
jgi:hypothetical protein